MSNGPVPECKGLDCGFAAFAGDVGCSDGGSCFHARMVDAEESKFHDAYLIKATQQIREALDAIPPDPNGRQLSFLQTGMGTMLAWVDHKAEIPANAIRASSPDDEVIKALGIVRPATAS